MDSTVAPIKEPLAVEIPLVPDDEITPVSAQELPQTELPHVPDEEESPPIPVRELPIVELPQVADDEMQAPISATELPVTELPQVADDEAVSPVPVVELSPSEIPQVSDDEVKPTVAMELPISEIPQVPDDEIRDPISATELPEIETFQVPDDETKPPVPMGELPTVEMPQVPDDEVQQAIATELPVAEIPLIPDDEVKPVIITELPVTEIPLIPDDEPLPSIPVVELPPTELLQVPDDEPKLPVLIEELLPAELPQVPDDESLPVAPETELPIVELPQIPDDEPLQPLPVTELSVSELPQVADEETTPSVPVVELPPAELPQVPDEELTQQEIFFSGQLRTNAPSYLLDPTDFTVLENYRYSPMGIKGRYGMSQYLTGSGYIVPHVKKGGTTVIHYRAVACTYAQVDGDIFTGDATNGIQKYNYGMSAWEALLDDWSGDWLYPNGAVVDAGAGIKDYSGFVYLDNTSTYLEAGALTSSDEIYLGFMDIPSEIWLDLVPEYVNTNASVMTLSRWKTTGYTADLTMNDGTIVAVGKTLGQSGQLTAITTTDIAKSTKYGIPHELYWFRIKVSLTLSDEVNIWQVRAKPKTSPPSGYKAVVAYKERLWLYGDTSNPNIFRYSKRNYPETWNGKDSGVLEIGENQPVSYAQPFVNEMTVYKQTGEVGIVEGYSPATFAYEKLSSYSGAVGARSIVPVETGVMTGEHKGAVTIYMSADGFRMCNGLSTPLISQSISAYFDKNDSRCIAGPYMHTGVAWMDYQNNEYHCAVQGLSAGTEFVYNLEFKKWSIFKRPVMFISAATFYESGQWLTLASTAAKVYELEDGTTDDGSLIGYQLETKDHFNNFIFNYRNFVLTSSPFVGTIALWYALDGEDAYLPVGAITLDLSKTGYSFCTLRTGLNLLGVSVRWKLHTINRLELHKYIVYSKPVRDIKEQPGS